MYTGIPIHGIGRDVCWWQTDTRQPTGVIGSLKVLKTPDPLTSRPSAELDPLDRGFGKPDPVSLILVRRSPFPPTIGDRDRE